MVWVLKIDPMGNKTILRDNGLTPVVFSRYNGAVGHGSRTKFGNQYVEGISVSEIGHTACG
jgi:hypothetical protein